LTVEPRPQPPDNLAHAVILGLPTPNRLDPSAPETIAALKWAQELVGLCDPAEFWFRTQPLDDLIDRLIERGQVGPER
jgi:hypothetical protein